MSMERLENLNDEVTEGRSIVKVEEEQVEWGGWIVTEVGGRVNIFEAAQTITDQQSGPFA